MNKICIRFSTIVLLFIFSTVCFGQETEINEESNFSKIKQTETFFGKEKEFNAGIEPETEKKVKPENSSEKEEVQTDNENQDKIKKYEVGFQVTWHRQKSFNEESPVFDVVFIVGGRQPFPSTCCQTEFGFGGRFGYNLNKNVALEIEGNFFPVDRLNPRSKEAIRIFGTNDFVRVAVEPQGRKIQAFAGPKIGIRKEKYGVFGKVRPGMYWVLQYPRVLALSSNPGFIGSARDWTGFFAVDIGGVFEYYPSKKTIIRFDVGDTIIHYRALDPKPFNPGFIRHTLQFTTGFGFRF